MVCSMKCYPYMDHFEKSSRYLWFCIYTWNDEAAKIINNSKQTRKYDANLILHPFLIIFLILTFEFSNGILNLFDEILGSKLQNTQMHKSLV